MKTLTEKQKNILRFIEEFMDAEGMAPTVYEIANNFGLKTSTVFSHLRALQRKKQLSRSSKARSISLTGRPAGRRRLPEGVYLIPLLGRINAGMPSESPALTEGQLCISATLAGNIPENQLFGLRVHGESMRDLGILDGDFVVVTRQFELRQGDIVVALLQGGEVTVKSYCRKNAQTIELHPANRDFPVQSYRSADVTIQGKVIGLQRKY